MQYFISAAQTRQGYKDNAATYIIEWAEKSDRFVEWEQINGVAQ